VLKHEYIVNQKSRTYDTIQKKMSHWVFKTPA
jgi:hypothetical protein